MAAESIMRTSLLAIVLASVQLIPLMAATRRKQTEAEGDGLLGPVKLVVTRSEYQDHQSYVLGVPTLGS